MEWKHLIYDNWSGVNANETTVRHPGWPQIEDVINALDGENRTSMTFSAEDGREIVVSGGPGKFIISVGFSDEEIYTLKDRNKTSAAVRLTTGGQEGIFTEQEAWGRPVAIQVARYFYEHGQRDPALPWEKVGEGG